MVIGYDTYNEFYKVTQRHDGNKTYEEFAKSPYYNAFVKFGSFVSNVHPLYPNKFIHYVVTSGVKLDHWCRDELYDKYVVEKNKKGSYKASKLGTFTENNFYKLKNAVAWCSFDNRTLVKKANRLHQLDQMIFSMDTEIQLHSKLIKKSKDEESTLIYLSKLTQNKSKKRSFANEINDFIQDYQRWQTKMFNTKPGY